MECENVVEQMHQHLQPLTLASTQFLDLQLERRLLGIVRLLQELRERLRFGGDPVGYLFGCIDGFDGMFLHTLPLAGRKANLFRHHLDVANLFDGIGQSFGFRELNSSPVLHTVRPDANDGRHNHTTDH